MEQVIAQLEKLLAQAREEAETYKSAYERMKALQEETAKLVDGYKRLLDRAQ
jgi:hypothetical protein